MALSVELYGDGGSEHQAGNAALNAKLKKTKTLNAITEN